MSEKVATLGGRMNSLKWVITLTLIGVGVWGNVTFGVILPMYLRILGLLFVSVCAVAVVLQTCQGKKIWQFAIAAKNEMRKVVWPTRQETIQSTAMVLAMVFIMGLILWGVDVLLIKVIAMITGFGSA